MRKSRCDEVEAREHLVRELAEVDVLLRVRHGDTRRQRQLIGEIEVELTEQCVRVGILLGFDLVARARAEQ